MVWAGPVVAAGEVRNVLAQALRMVRGWAHVAADEVPAVPAHLREHT